MTGLMSTETSSPTCVPSKIARLRTVYMSNDMNGLVTNWRFIGGDGIAFKTATLTSRRRLPSETTSNLNTLKLRRGSNHLFWFGCAKNGLVMEIK